MTVKIGASEFSTAAIPQAVIWSINTFLRDSVKYSEEPEDSCQWTFTACLWGARQTFMASSCAASSRDSARVHDGKNISANPKSWQKTMRTRGRGTDKFCLADTGLPDDDITAARKARNARALLCCTNRDLRTGISLANRQFRLKMLSPRETIWCEARPSRWSVPGVNLCLQGCQE